MNELINKVIKKIQLDSKNQHVLKFTTSTNEELYYQTWGDCCSDTWFADIIGVQNLLDSQVNSVEKLEFDSQKIKPDGRCRQEVDQYYGFKLITNRGFCDIIFRNSSNGYYGGSIDFMKNDNQWFKPWKIEFREIINDYPC